LHRTELFVKRHSPDNALIYTCLPDHVLVGDCCISPKLASLAPRDGGASPLNFRIGLAAKEET